MFPDTTLDKVLLAIGLLLVAISTSAVADQTSRLAGLAMPCEEGLHAVE